MGNGTGAHSEKEEGGAGGGIAGGGSAASELEKIATDIVKSRFFEAVTVGLPVSSSGVQEVEGGRGREDVKEGGRGKEDVKEGKDSYLEPCNGVEEKKRRKEDKTEFETHRPFPCISHGEASSDSEVPSTPAPLPKHITSYEDTKIEYREDGTPFPSSESISPASEVPSTPAPLPPLPEHAISYDPDCTECHLTRPTPSEDELVMFLHALSYKVHAGETRLV